MMKTVGLSAVIAVIALGVSAPGDQGRRVYSPTADEVQALEAAGAPVGLQDDARLKQMTAD
jgi:hypothetical protein